MLVATGALQPKGTRLRLSNGKFTVTDGPFIELKELMAGRQLFNRGSRFMLNLKGDYQTI